MSTGVVAAWCAILGTVALGLVAKVYIKLTNGRCVCTTRLDGKTVVITGATAGIGRHTALVLAARGARVVIGCRNVVAGEAVRHQANVGDRVVVHRLDFESLDSVRAFCATVNATESRLDVLINNAGAGGLGDRLTKDGLHVGMQVNHFAPFLLTNLLLDLLKKSAPSRIITVASMLHRQAQFPANLPDLIDNKNHLSDVTVYCNSKLCNILMTNELAERLEGTGVTSNCLHPGAVRTQLFRHIPQPIKLIWDFYAFIYFKSVEEGAQTTIHLALAESLVHTSGMYFEDCLEADVAQKARDSVAAKQLWKVSEQAVQL